MRRAIIPATLIFLAGCSVLPGTGPLLSQVESESAVKRRFPYEYITLTPEIAAIIADPPAEAEVEFARDEGPERTVIQPGDLVSVTIAESGVGGLFSAPPSNGFSNGEQGARVVTLPDTAVDQNGRIVVPFAGERKIGGLTTTQAAEAIRAGLAGQAINPQVTVNLTHGTGSRVVISGDVHTPGLHVPQGNGETLLEAIAIAGGTTGAPARTVIQLNRHGLVHRVRMQAMLDQPSLNVHVRNGDYVHVYTAPGTYTVLGAENKPLDEDLPVSRLSLAAAMGRAGGLADERADPASILVARFEPRATMERVWAVMIKEARLHGQDISGEIAERTRYLRPDAQVPVLYRLDLRNGTGLFMAREIAVREDDLLYVSDSPSTQIQKALDTVRLRFDIGTRAN